LKTYTIGIEEVVSGVFTVEAEEADSALDIAIAKYKNGDFVIESGEVHARNIAVLEPKKEQTIWLEF